MRTIILDEKYPGALVVLCKVQGSSDTQGERQYLVARMNGDACAVHVWDEKKFSHIVRYDRESDDQADINPEWGNEVRSIVHDSFVRIENELIAIGKHPCNTLEAIKIQMDKDAAMDFGVEHPEVQKRREQKWKKEADEQYIAEAVFTAKISKKLPTEMIYTSRELLIIKRLIKSRMTAPLSARARLLHRRQQKAIIGKAPPF